MTVADVGQRMSSREGTEWLALWRLEAEESAAGRIEADLAVDAELALRQRRRRQR